MWKTVFLILGVPIACALFYLAVVFAISRLFPDYDDWDEE